MNSQYSTSEIQSSTTQQCKEIPVIHTSTSSLFPNQASRIMNLSPFMNPFEDEQDIAYLSNQRYTIHSSGRSGRAVPITQPHITYDFPLLNETGILVNQIRRSEVSLPYQYKPSIHTKQIPSATLYTTALIMDGLDEETQETPIHVTHIYQPKSRGIKQAAKAISQLGLPTSYLDIDESPMQVDQLHRLRSPQYIKYKIHHNIQPSTGSILKMPSVFSQEEPGQGPSFKINQLRQATVQRLCPTNTRKQQISSIIQPRMTIDPSGFGESSVQLDQIHRPIAPQIIQYRIPVDIQPSTGSIIKNTSTLTDEELFGETSVILNQLRQRHAQLAKQHFGFV